MNVRKIPGQQAWTVHDDDGAQIGRLVEKKMGKGHTTFWSAFGIHPDLGIEVPLELRADREQRLATIAAFRADPDAYRQHWGWIR